MDDDEDGFGRLDDEEDSVCFDEEEDEEETGEEGDGMDILGLHRWNPLKGRNPWEL